MTKATVAIAALGLLTFGMTLGGAAMAQEEKGLKAHVLIMEKPEELRKWMNSKPADRGGDSARLRTVHSGKKIFFPVIATGVEAPGAGRATEIFADIEFVDPRGKVVGSRKRCCSATIRGSTDTAFSLGPVVDLELEPSDLTGTYTVKVKVIDGAQTATATETFTYDGTAAKAASSAAAPKAAPEPAAKPASAQAPKDTAPQAPRKAPSKSRDVSHCLGLPTPAEVIKCTEKAP